MESVLNLRIPLKVDIELETIGMRRIKNILSIAGVDSSGGAGIYGDLKTISALGCYGAAITTALTAQNTKTVKSVFACDIEFINDQFESIFEDIKIDFVKIGMLFNKNYH